jgi:hypothetical protein
MKPMADSKDPVTKVEEKEYQSGRRDIDVCLKERIRCGLIQSQ